MITICPARLEPIFSPRPWGSKSLAPFFPEKSNLAEPIGEAWMTGSECRFASGPFAGEELGEAWSKMPVEWTGTRIPRRGSHANSRFPLLAKFIFAEEKLSLQVHPDDDYASRHESAAGGLGKTEMWYAVNARSGADVLAGLKPDITLESFEYAIANGTAEECLDRIPLASGDAVFVPAGTVHTIGPGLVLCEIQEQSDLTYRVYDYNRRDAKGRVRELHVDKALQVIRFGKQMGGKIQQFRIERDPVTETHFVVCPYFAVEKWEFKEPLLASTSPEYFELWIILDGSGEIRWGRERTTYGPVQAWLIPAALGDYEITPETSTSLLRAHVPGDLSEASRSLEARGIPATTVARLVHQ
jgi:mannose-6-phosphate isomerase